MRQFRLLGVGIAAIILIGITACSPSAVATQPASVPATEEIATAIVVETQSILPSAEVQVTETTAAETPAIETPAIDVDALIREKINNNHTIDRVYAANKTREEWNTTLNRMISYGAKISEEEKQIIIDYLLSRK